MQLELTERNARIVSATPNRELHGQDPKSYMALKFTLNLQPDDLAMLHPDLRGVLYKKKEKQEGDLAEQGQDQELRFKHLGPDIAWKDEQAGGKLTIHYGTSEKSHIVLPGIHLSKVKLEPLDGGTIAASFLVVGHPDEKQMGRLGMMVGTEIPISIEPPSAEELEQQRIEAEGDQDPDD